MTPPPKKPRTKTPPEIAVLRDRILRPDPEERKERALLALEEARHKPKPQVEGTTLLRDPWWVRFKRWLRGGS